MVRQQIATEYNTIHYITYYSKTFICSHRSQTQVWLQAWPPCLGMVLPLTSGWKSQHNLKNHHSCVEQTTQGDSSLAHPQGNHNNNYVARGAEGYHKAWVYRARKTPPAHIGTAIPLRPLSHTCIPLSPCACHPPPYPSIPLCMPTPQPPAVHLCVFPCKKKMSILCSQLKVCRFRGLLN